MNPSKYKVAELTLICKLISGRMEKKLDIKHGVEEQTWVFSQCRHAVSLLLAKASQHLGVLNDICDTLRKHKGVLTTIRCATAPNWNCFSNAKHTRNPEMAGDLFWTMLKHLESISEGFGMDRKYRTLPELFKKTISAMDSFTMKFFTNCIDRVKYRRLKAAAMMHMSLDFQEFLSKVITIKTAGTHDSAETVKQGCML